MLVARTSEVAPQPLGEHELPQRPLVVIRPNKSLFDFGLHEVWEYRELLYFLMWRDVKVRYKQTILGVIWVILQPLLMMVIFTFFFGNLAGIKSDDGMPYGLFAYAGLLPWTFFATAVNTGSNSMVGSASLITKVYFPRLIVPVAAVGAILLDLAISLCVLSVLMAYWRVVPGWGILMLPVIIVLVTGLALGFGTLMSGLNVKYRDIRIALPFLIQVWFFLTPVVYPVSLLPARWRWLLELNPMTGIVEGFRSALYSQRPFRWGSLAISTAFVFVLLVSSIFSFKRMERRFADIV